MTKKTVRCAIYTRKSSDEGLEQEFNSLDAQREACAAYIASQKGEGWQMLTDRYDDGGISGATLERPGLQRLLADIDAGNVDLIIVYKVDRLTRSLADFSRLVDRFDQAGASFVSVTQQFNTATSMGRLTLNVLLSFAQFEREVTAERIRDKIAASKKKGMWMGVRVPLGYDASDRTLIVNDEEADTVRTLFLLYRKLGCVRRLKEEADRLGLISKQHRDSGGRITGGVPFSRGRLYHLLQNPVYVGEIRHKDQRYPGQHQPIVDRALFEAVQQMLGANRRGSGSRKLRATASPLAGKLVDETGDRLTPSHAVRRGKRHRYYISRRLVAKSGEPGTGGWRLPAAALEEAAARLIRQALTSPRLVRGTPPERLAAMPAALEALGAALAGEGCGPLLNALVETGHIAPGQLAVTLDATALAAQLGVAPDQIDPDALAISGAFTLRRRGVEAKLVLDSAPAAIDPVLVRSIARGRAWFEEIKAGTPMQAIAARENISQRRVAHLVDLAFLAPDIVQLVTDGRQPAALTADGLIRTHNQSLWIDQRAWLAGL